MKTFCRIEIVVPVSDKTVRYSYLKIDISRLTRKNKVCLQTILFGYLIQKYRIKNKIRKFILINKTFKIYMFFNYKLYRFNQL